MSRGDAKEHVASPPTTGTKLDAKALHALAAAEKDRHAAKRIRAVAYFAEGKSSLDVAVRVRSNMETVLGWRRTFFKRGIDGLRVARRGARCRLTPRQLRELAAFVRANPAATWSELRAFVEKRFKVTYTKEGV